LYIETGPSNSIAPGIFHGLEVFLGRAAHVVIKEVHLKGFYKGKVDEQSKWLRRELDSLRELAHPGVVKLRSHCFADDGSKAYLALEKCDIDLNRLILPSDDDVAAKSMAGAIPRSPEDFRRVFRSLLEALAHIHEKKIAHRDIKPDNVLVVFRDARDPVFKISDFDKSSAIIKEISQLKTSFTLSPTGPVYTAPELRSFQGPKQYSMAEHAFVRFYLFFSSFVFFVVLQKCDIFSLGCVFFFIVSGGKHLFIREDFDAYHNRVLEIENLPHMREVMCKHPLFAHLIKSMVDRRQRPSAAECLKQVALWPCTKLPHWFTEANRWLRIRHHQGYSAEFDLAMRTTLPENWKAELPTPELINVEYSNSASDFLRFVVFV
jgi:serine/threonine-protein kinase/endoribonuclease IRE1